MAVLNAKTTTLWVHDVAVDTMANRIRMDRSFATSPKAVFGDGAHTFTLGLLTVTAAASGYIDFTVKHAELEALGTGEIDSVVTLCPTATEGDKAIMHSGLLADFTPLDATLGETAAFDVGLAGRSRLVPIDGINVHAYGDETSTANGTAYELGAVASGESLYSHLHVFDVSGTNPTLDVVIASDTEEAFGDTPETQITHAEATGLTAERLSVAGAITDTWWRAQWTIGGTDTPTFTFGVALGIL